LEVTGWLRSLGLQQYADAFRDNAVDAEVLLELTADDLRDLGVTLIGHRRKLLAAITALRAEKGSPAPAPEASAGSAARLGVDAERRQLTVLFCDLVGSTALSARSDPEDLREVIGAYHGCVADTVARFEGFVAKYMGDGVLVYFGYPQAHEDDAERAVRAGLALIQAVGRLDGREPLQARVGIASGLVVVGDLIGTGAAQERGVVGETPNLAARLQTLAAPATLLIAEPTRRQIGGLFELDDLGTQNLAGFPEPQRVWRVIAEAGVANRFEALRSGATPLVGREEELELLERRWRQAKDGEGRVVLVSGEPGIGKSRLTAELARRIKTEPHIRLRYFCAPHHQDSALYPFIVQLERAASFAREDSPEDRLGKLGALLGPSAQDRDEIELFAELLSLPSRAGELGLSSQRKREKLFEALLHQLEALARQRPVLMAFEDAHWIDPTSRELMDLTVARVARLPVLLVITFRPEFQPPWVGQPHVTMLALNRLAQRQVTALVLGVAGNAPLGSDIVEEIADRTDGVPLFVEELTKAVLERAEQENRVAAVLAASPVPALAVPATLHASLIARLDRIGAAAKEVAQIGAVLGREFGYDLIRRLVPRPDLDAALAQLTEAGLLFCHGQPPQSSYLFKHALVQDAAYGTLLRSRRQELHAGVAAVLERDFADLVERQPELLAHHLTSAGEAERAVDEWLKAGEYAARRLAHVEAIRHFERGLSELAELPAGPDRDRREIELQLARGLCFFMLTGFTAPEAAEAYARARELAERHGDARQRFMALYGLWQSANGAGNIVECRGLSQRLQGLTAEHADNHMQLQAHHSAWATSLFAGEVIAAREHAEAGRRLYDPERHRFDWQLYGGHDAGACSRYIGAQAEWLLGRSEHALALAREALEMADRIAHPFSQAIALQYNAMLHLDRGEPEAALERIAAAEAIAAEQRLGFVVEPTLVRGAALTALGDRKEGMAVLRDGLTRPGASRIRCFGLAKLADALIEQGKYDAALAAAREGLKTVEHTGHAQWEAELRRAEALALHGLKELQEGEAMFRVALAVARRQQARGYELRAATSLARLWGEQGRRAEARDLLAPVYGGFTEGFETADLKVAKALLSELA
jgi:class 3 adenylate cyclase/tetratricopeptide (TPR) repeat protein